MAAPTNTRLSLSDIAELSTLPCAYETSEKMDKLEKDLEKARETCNWNDDDGDDSEDEASKKPPKPTTKSSSADHSNGDCGQMASLTSAMKDCLLGWVSSPK